MLNEGQYTAVQKVAERVMEELRSIDEKGVQQVLTIVFVFN